MWGGTGIGERLQVQAVFLLGDFAQDECSWENNSPEKQYRHRPLAPWRAKAAKDLIPLFCFLPGAQMKAGHWLHDCRCGLGHILRSQEGAEQEVDT